MTFGEENEIFKYENYHTNLEKEVLTFQMKFHQIKKKTFEVPFGS